MNNFSMYQKNAGGVFSNCFVTKLLRNYRCARRESLRMLGDKNLICNNVHFFFQVSSCHSQNSQWAFLWWGAAGLCRWVRAKLLLRLGRATKKGIDSSFNKCVLCSVCTKNSFTYPVFFYCFWKSKQQNQFKIYVFQNFPVIFHGVTGIDKREASSPSFFNVAEVEVLIGYVRKLLQAQGKKGMAKIAPRDIGIIAPYRKQVWLNFFTN